MRTKRVGLGGQLDYERAPSICCLLSNPLGIETVNVTLYTEKKRANTACNCVRGDFLMGIELVKQYVGVKMLELALFLV